MRMKKMISKTLALALAATMLLQPVDTAAASEPAEVTFEEVQPEAEETAEAAGAAEDAVQPEKKAVENAAPTESEAVVQTAEAETVAEPAEEEAEVVFDADEPAAGEALSTEAEVTADAGEETVSYEDEAEADVYETVSESVDPDGKISVEFQLAPEAGKAVFTDKAILGSGYTTTPGQTSNLVRFADERVDGMVRVANGETIGSAFTRNKESVFPNYPSLDPLPQGYRAIFLGWHVSFSQSKLYTSDELAKLKISGPTFVWAEWSTEDVIEVTFEAGSETSRIRDYLRREDSTTSVVKYVKRNANLRDLFLTSTGWNIEAMPIATDKAFYGWMDAGNEFLQETDWKYAEDTTLVPIYRSRTYGVTGVRISKVKADNRIITGHEVQAYTGEEVKLTATVLGGAGTPAWTAVDEDGNIYSKNTNNGVIKGLTVSSDHTVCSFKCRAGGTITITASVGNYKDTIIIHITPAIEGLVWGDVKDPASKEATAERKLILYDKCYQSGPGVNGRQLILTLSPSTTLLDKIYISTTRGFEKDDFFTLYDADGRELPYDESTGTGAARRQVAQASKGKLNLTVSIPYPVSGETRVAHAGATTLTFTSEDGKFKLVCKLYVAGYDEEENVLYTDAGVIVKDEVRRLYGGSLSPFANSVDFYFDAQGHAHKGGLVRRENGTYILIDDLKEVEPGQQAFVYNSSGKVTNGAYYYGDQEFFIDKTGEVRSGWMSFTGVRSDGKYFDVNKKYYDKEDDFQPAKNRFVETSGAWYYVGADGYRLTGRQVNPDGSGNTYFFQEKVDDNIGKMQTGWVLEDATNKLYYWYDQKTGARAPLNSAVTDGTTMWYQSETRGRLAGAQIDSVGWVWLTAAGSAQVSKYYPEGYGTVTGYYVVDQKTGALAKNRLVTTAEGTWYFGENGLPVTGTRLVGKVWYCFDGPFGQDATTDVTDGYSLRDTGAAVMYRVDKNDKATYQKWVDAVSRVVLNKQWLVDDEGNSYYVVKGKLVSGWQTIDRQRYHFNVTGRLTAPDEASLVTIDGKKYYLDSNTADLPGKCLVNQWVGGDAESDYYAGKTGIPVTGKQTIVVEGVKKTFFFNVNTAKKLKGTKVRVGKTLYYLDEDTGAVETSAVDHWHDATDKDFYITKAGAIRTGWVTINEGVKNTYYFTADGEKLTGLQENTIAAKTIYYLDDTTGVRVTNAWVEQRYFGKDGKALKGKKKVNGQWYIFQDNGERYEDVIVRDGSVVYMIDSNGIATPAYAGDVEDHLGNHYVVKTGGKIITGLVTTGTVRRYYIKGTGVLARDGFYLVDKKWGYFDEYGVQQTSVNAVVRTVGGTEDEGNLFLTCDAKTGLVTAFKDDAGKKLANVKITLANGQQYILGKDGMITIGWYSFRNPTTRVLYKYRIGASGRLDQLCAETLEEKTGSPLLKVDGQVFYQSLEDGVILSPSGIREAYDGDDATGYYVNTNGEVQFSKKLTVGSQFIYVDATGHRATGWYRTNGVWSYVVDGTAVKNRTIRLTALGGTGDRDLLDTTLTGFVNTATGEPLIDLAPYTIVDINGKQSKEWVDSEGNKLNGTYEAEQEDGSVLVITFSKGVMQVGKVKVYDSVTNAVVQREFNGYTGCATYKK